MVTKIFYRECHALWHAVTRLLAHVIQDTSTPDGVHIKRLIEKIDEKLLTEETKSTYYAYGTEFIKCIGCTNRTDKIDCTKNTENTQCTKNRERTDYINGMKGTKVLDSTKLTNSIQVIEYTNCIEGKDNTIWTTGNF